MSAWALRTFAIGGMAVVQLFLVGCAVDTRPYSSAGSAGGSAYSGAPSGSAATASALPMLVDVDTDHTMTAQPGDGVGVFTEYAAGGHWHVWWTCDTNKTHLGCGFEVSVSTASGAITNVAGEMLAPGDRLVQSSASQVDLVTQTLEGIDGVWFDAPPGVAITVDTRLGGVEDGGLFFFVQDNLVNGDYKGALTDPLMFEPSIP